ncbi:MAG TPA: malto-oligosyltrehalose trehalohydrolase [Candidatus Acidoferrum sp.]|nr:malto-oligosyltrehalose trehalohydrolase [Candidatus Acidoferrum sp.]
MSIEPVLKLGATYAQGCGCDFLVWAPHVSRLDLHVLSPFDRLISMQQEENGYFRNRVKDAVPGSLYFYRLDNALELPDPASRFQPQGVHGPSQVVSPFFEWHDKDWRTIELRDYVLYELHVGTFTHEGRFDAIIPRLAQLRDLGITAIELMPVAQFPGSRNWGYDGVFPFAVQESYGGPLGLKRLVNACHQAELAVVLDVVYNHLGPEGNYLARFGPYFTDLHRTPWGEAINFDKSGSDEVRRYFIENALFWITDFHVDALRLDAVHAITDTTARPFLAELADTVHREAERQRRRVYLIPESDQNDARLVSPRDVGGLGLDAQWNDDFHHAVHALLTGERDGYYADFGTTAQLARAFSDGFVFTGQYSRYRGRRQGSSSERLPAERLIVFAQNHDQVGNRCSGDRLASSVSFEGLKLAAGLVILSPFLPLFFMGEEYGEAAPFHYFVCHGDPALIEAVRKGRREEFSRFAWKGESPDPQDEATFLRSRISWDLREEFPHKHLLALYKELLHIRRENPVMCRRDKNNLEALVSDQPKSLCVRRWHGEEQVIALFNFEKQPTQFGHAIPAGHWERLLDSSDSCWGGSGSDLPALLDSSEETEISLPGSAFALFGIIARVC